MRRTRPHVPAFVVVAAALGLGAVRADRPPDPARFLPPDAELFARADNPRQLVDWLRSLDAVQDLAAFAPTKEFLESTPATRFFRFVAYFESELGHEWPELIDRLAGGGIALGVGYHPEPHAALAIQGTDPELSERFLTLAVGLLESELARAESTETVERGRYRDNDGYRLGKNLLFARVGAAVVFASSREAMEAAVDRHLDAEDPAAPEFVGRARDLLDGEPVAWLALDYSRFKSSPEAEAVLKSPRDDGLLTFLFAGWLDVAARSDFLAAGAYAEPGRFRAVLRLPAGRDGLPEELALHVPPTGKSGTLPLLKPEGVIFSHSFYLDLDAFYRYRDELFTEQNARELEKGAREGSRFLPAASIPTLLERAGPYHRVVVARPIDAGYATKPLQPVPSVGYVLSMRDPEFVRTAGPLLRAAGFAFSLQAGLKLVEEEYDGVKIAGYRFPEGRPFPAEDPDLTRFAFVPCYAHVGDQFVVASGFEFCRELIDLLRAEPGEPASEANMRMRFHAAGVRALLETVPDRVVTQAVLDQAIPVEQAEAQAKLFFDWLSGLGSLTLQTTHGVGKFGFDITWESGRE